MSMVIGDVHTVETKGTTTKRLADTKIEMKSSLCPSNLSYLGDIKECLLYQQITNK